MLIFKNKIQLAKQTHIADETQARLNLVKKEFAISFEVEDSHLSAWLTWHEAVQGKWLRARLALSAGEQLGLSKQTSVIWAVVCELIHSASLLHDDICDQDTLRRGKAAVWKEFGISAAICTGDFLIAEAFRKITEIEQGWHQTILLKLLSCTVKEIIFGQSQDLTYKPLTASNDLVIERDDWQRYSAIAIQKTAPLISLPIMGMLHCAEVGPAVGMSLTNISQHLGLAYQLLNDLENILKTQQHAHQLEELPSDIYYGRANGVVMLCMHTASIQERIVLGSKSMQVLHLLHSKNAISQSFALVYEQVAKSDDLNHQLPIVIGPILLNIAKEIRNRSIKLQEENPCLA